MHSINLEKKTMALVCLYVDMLINKEYCIIYDKMCFFVCNFVVINLIPRGIFYTWKTTPYFSYVYIIIRDSVRFLLISNEKQNFTNI